MKMSENIVIWKRDTKNILYQFSKMKERISFLKRRIITIKTQLKRFRFFFFHSLISSSISFFCLLDFVLSSSTSSFYIFSFSSSHLSLFAIHMRSLALSFARQFARSRFFRRKSWSLSYLKRSTKRRISYSINLISYTRLWMKALSDWKIILYYN